MDKILTISVAAYHVESCLAQCLDSFAAADVAEALEVLIINDGSGEAVSAIAREYERKYPTVFRLIEQENGGHGSTVNRGIQEAAGVYFKTVDGDDYVDAQALRELVLYLADADADLVVTDYFWVEDRTGRILSEKRTDFAGKAYRKEYLFDDICDEIYVNMHAATFRTQLLRDMKKTLFTHCFYVDAQYVLYPVPLIRTVVFLENPVYHYRLGQETQSMAMQSMQKNRAHHERVLTSLLAFYEEQKEQVSPAKRRYLAKGAAKILTSQIKIYLSFPPDKQWKQEIRKLDQRVKAEAPEVYDSVTNRAVKLLRGSRYLLYRAASRLCRLRYR